MKSDPLKKRIRVSHFGNMNYLGNTPRLIAKNLRSNLGLILFKPRRAQYSRSLRFCNLIQIAEVRTSFLIAVL